MTQENDIKILWDKTLAEMELKISKPNFLTWLKNSQLVEKNNSAGVVYVALNNNFARDWVKNNYNKDILNILRNFDEKISRIEYIISTEKIKSINTIKTESKQTKENNPLQTGMDITGVDGITNLHGKYIFDNFVVGSSNELAYAASLAVSKDVGTKYNPFFVYGNTGLGKTHLIQALGNEIIKNYKNRIKVKYVPSEKFVNDVVWAIRSKKMDYIKDKYRTIDVLIIDDIQFIGGKTRSEEEFFHTFNILYQNNKQIILSSDRPPSAIPTLEDRLRSRFEGGMIVDITHPDYEMKLAIIKNKSDEIGFKINEEISNFIASKIQRSVREIEGIIKKLYFYSEFKGGSIDIKQTKEIVESMIQESELKINPSNIIKVVSDFFEIQQNELTGKSRHKEIVVPRQIVMFLFRDMLGMSYPDIGKKIGKRDHTTAIHSYEKIANKIKVDKDINQKIISIKDLLSKNYTK